MILVVGGGEERTVTVESSEMAANVTGLLPGTEYMFRVVAVSEFRCVQALSPPSNNVTSITKTTGKDSPCWSTRDCCYMSWCMIYMSIHVYMYVVNYYPSSTSSSVQ